MKNKKDLLVRTITGFCLMLVLLPSVYFGGLYFLIVSIILSVIGTYELMNMFYKKHNNLKTMRYIMPIFSGLTVVSFYCGINYSMNSIMFIPYIIGIIFAMAFGIFKDGAESNDILSCITSITYGGLLLACAVSVEYLPIIENEGYEVAHITGRLFIYLYSIVACTDMFAYLFGCKFGKHKFSKVSPKKSIEGCVAGIFGAILTSLLYTLALNTFAGLSISYLTMGLICAVLSVVGQVGDFAASVIKRHFEVKDYSNIFPGHGGMLDRIDSVMFIAPFAYLLLMLFV